MHRLAQPEVLRAATLAAAASAVVSLPRIVLWQARPYPLWYLEALLFLGGIVLWGFVFAWHTPYTGMPVFAQRFEPVPLVAATVVGLAAAVCQHLLLDPRLRSASPQDFPINFQQWLARTLFHLGFVQLFLIFAPFAWLMRLFRNQKVAVALTVFFGLVVVLIRNRSSQGTMPSELLFGFLLARLAGGLFSLWLYLRGGVLVVWWWGLVVEARLLVELGK